MDSELLVNDKKIEIKNLSWNQSFAELLKNPYSLIVGEVTDKGQLDILENLRLPDPKTWVGVYLINSPKDTVRKALNSSKIKFVVDQQRNVKAELTQIIQNQEIQRRQTWLLREYYQRHKTLESLTEDLERIVLERTLHLEQANKDQSDRNQNERSLIRFIKEIASFSDVEDIMTFLRREFRKYHGVNEPILCLQGDKGGYIYSFRTGGVQRLNVSKPFDFLKQENLNINSASKELANLLARPVAKGSFFSFSLDHLSQFYKTSSKALLYFEHSLPDSREFDELVQERINPISISLDRILLEQELDIFSYRWEKTFDGIKDPVAIIDVNYNVLRSNRKFIVSQKDQKCYRTFAGRDSVCPGCPMSKAVELGEPQSGEIRVAQGVYVVRSYPIRLVENEKASSFVHQYTDLTETKELHVKLLQNEKMGALGTLAGHIAHELNNPLTGIRSLAQVLGAEVEDDQAKKDLKEIENSAARCQKIIKNLLEFSQDKEGEKEMMSLDEVVERTMPMLKTALRSHRLYMELQTREEKIYIFSHLLQQVVFNLVNNACQAMKQPGEVSISTRIKGNTVELEIADTGPGIPIDIQARVFEPFFTTKPPAQGTGLGLSIAKTIVEKCGGEISLSSESGKGTSFFLRFSRGKEK